MVHLQRALLLLGASAFACGLVGCATAQQKQQALDETRKAAETICRALLRPELEHAAKRADDLAAALKAQQERDEAWCGPAK